MRGNYWILLKYDLAEYPKSAGGALFLAFSGIFWFMFFYYLSGGGANLLADPSANQIFGWFFDASLARQYFIANPATLSAYFYIALITLPLFVIVAASNQTAGDVASGCARFIAPRCSRTEYYLSRFTSVVIILQIFYLVTGIIAVLLSLSVDDESQTQIIGYGFEIIIVLAIYCVPFVGFMALFTSLTGSIIVANVAASSTYLIVTGLATYGSLKYPIIEYFGYLLPNSLKTSLSEINFSFGLFLGFLTLFIYTFVYVLAGWWFFKRRDI